MMRPANLRNRLVAAALGWIPVLILSAVGRADEDWNALLSRVPRDANAVLALDVEALKQTKLGQRHTWTAKDAAMSDRPLFLPPESQKILVAALLDPGQEMQRQWELGVIRLTEPLSLEAAAQSEGGYVDKMGDQKVAWTPSDAYIVPLEPTLAGIMYPANRQNVSRWINAAKGAPEVQVSDYLKSAMSELNGKTQIVLSFDLQNVLQPHRVHETLRETEAINAKPEKREEIARIISGLQGVTLLLSVDRGTEATLRFDFSESAAPFANFAKPLFLAVLDRMGMALEEPKNWPVRSEGNSVIAHGELKTTSLRRILSLLEVPTTKFSSVENPTPSPGDPQSMADASLKYFRSVSTLIDDLGSTLQDTRDNHARWMERYGQKIDRLPILNVDPELLEWGADVATHLRDAALVKRGSGLRTGVRQARSYNSYDYSYNGYGYYGRRDQTSQNIQVKTEERARANATRFQTWKEIEDSRADIRRTLTQKYNVEF